ncbi:MAG: hypothetical protein E6R14_08625 [Thermomicrobiales bacterium]|nr:MAG: hypothetical protein E6R14_08625 [Thermomicrobiales bacterium]
MTSSLDQPEFKSGEAPCSYHPDVITGLRCSRCGKPICPKCGVRTPVGMRCPDCAGVRGLPTYRTDSNTLVKSAIAGLVVAILVGVILGYLPEWNFYLTLVLGFGVAEAMARLSSEKRGHDLQVVGWIAVALGLVISRWVLMDRLGLPWEVVRQMPPGLDRFMNLELLPDGVIAVIPFLIVYLRFR